MQDAHSQEYVTCLVHLVGGLLAVGTSLGAVHVFSEAAHICSYDVYSPAQYGSGGVQAIVQRGRGFIVAGGCCDVVVFDPPPSRSTRCDSTRDGTLPAALSGACKRCDCSMQRCLFLQTSRPLTPSRPKASHPIH